MDSKEGDLGGHSRVYFYWHEKRRFPGIGVVLLHFISILAEECVNNFRDMRSTGVVSPQLISHLVTLT